MSYGSVDFLGAEQNLSVLAGCARIYEMALSDDRAVALDISDVTFDGVVTARDGSTVGIEVSHVSEEVGVLRVVFPDLEAGEYRYELRAVDDSGECRRVVFGTLGALETSLDLERRREDADVLRLQVLIPCKSAARIMLEWHATTDAARAAATAVGEADRAKAEADRAEAEADRAEGAAAGSVGRLEDLIGRADEAVAKVEAMDGRLGGIDAHIRDSIVPNAATNTWWIAGKDSHYQVTGDPGRSPYVGTRGTWMVWDEDIRAYRDTGLDPQGKPGRSPRIGANGNWLSWNEVREVWEDTGVRALGRDGINGSAVRRILVDGVADIPLSGDTCNGGFYYYVPCEGGYDVYAWVEAAAGGASWVRVGLANDIATAEVFGLVKMGTDVVVADGAPVGVNGQRRLSVPPADYVTPGVVRPSVAATLGSGGGVGLDADGRMYADVGGYHKTGAVALSFNGVCEVPCVGLMEDGTVGLPWATLYQPGVAKLGSSFNQLNRIPYQQGVGATSDHQLANNLLYGGAIQHKKRAAWLQHGMDWLDGMGASQYLNDHDFYMGVVTSAQFEQSEAVGLVLRAATTDRLAGVHLAASMADTRATAVTTASMTLGYLQGNYYSKGQVDAKDAAIAGRFAEYSTTVQMQGYVSGRLQDYVSFGALDARGYATMGYVDQLDGENMKVTANAKRVYVLPPDEFEATRGNRDPKGIYIKATMR